VLRASGRELGYERVAVLFFG
jgi:hypothetical protein